jgi:hypothetical protein
MPPSVAWPSTRQRGMPPARLATSGKPASLKSTAAWVARLLARHCAVVTPSTTSPEAVMKAASSEARKTMPLTMSVTVPRRPIGSRSNDCCRAASRSLVPVGSSHRDDLTAHIGLGNAGMDQIDADAVALAREFERRRFGEQRDPALCHRIKRIARRADDPGNRRQIDDGAAVWAALRAVAQCWQSELGAAASALGERRQFRHMHILLRKSQYRQTIARKVNACRFPAKTGGPASRCLQ